GGDQAAAGRQIFYADRFYAVNQTSDAAGNKIKSALGGRISRHLFYVYNRSISLCNRVMTNEQKSGSRTALVLLLAINLFNYIDRYVFASVFPTLNQQFFAGDTNQTGKDGLCT